MAWSELRSCLNFIFPNSSTAETVRKMAVKNQDVLQNAAIHCGGDFSLKCYSKWLLLLSLCYERGSTNMSYFTHTERYVSTPNFSHKICKKILA